MLLADLPISSSNINEIIKKRNFGASGRRSVEKAGIWVHTAGNHSPSEAHI